MAAVLKKATDQSIERIKSQIKEYYDFGEIIEVENGCHRWSGKSSEDYICKHFKLINKETHLEENSKIGIHRVICFLKYKETPIKGKTDCSHICHRSWCLNPDHLSLELRLVNNQRKACNKKKECSGKHVCELGNNLPNCIFN